nr:hypothetical protein [Luteococcus japonicus]
MKALSGYLMEMKDAEDHAQRRQGHRIAGSAVGGGPGDEAGCEPVQRQGVQHARRRVQATISGAQRGRDQDEVHDAGGVRHVDQTQHLHEGALAHGATAGGRELPGLQGDDDGDGTDVEQHQAHDHGLGGARDVALGVLTLRRGHGDVLGAAEAEDGHHGAHQDARDAMGSEALPSLTPGEVPQPGLRLVGQAEEDQHQTQRDEDHDHGHLDHAEPVLALAIDLHGGEVDGDDQQGGEHRAQADAHPRPVVLEVGAGGHHLDADGDAHHHGDIPAHEPAADRAQIGVGGGTKASGDGVHDGHLRQGPDHGQREQAGEGVAEDDAGSRLGDHGPRSEEESGTQCTGQPDHGHLAAGQPPMQGILIAVGVDELSIGRDGAGFM